MGVGQSDTVNNNLCRYCFQVHPFLATKAPGSPVFGHCPYIPYCVIEKILLPCSIQLKKVLGVNIAVRGVDIAIRGVDIAILGVDVSSLDVDI